MLELIRKNKYFLVPYLIVLIIGAGFLIAYSKNQIHIYLNQWHCSFTDFIFKYITYLGDGVAVAIFMVLLLFVRYRYFIIMTGSVLISTIIVQSFKRFIMDDIVRPPKHFEHIYNLYFVDGVEQLSFNSFPSGHSASAFGIFIMAALISRSNMLKFLFFSVALLTAYSRVYLSHHFLIDIYFGSLFSVIISLFMFYWGLSWKNPKLDNSLISKNQK